MKSSLLLLAVIGVIVLFHTLHQGQASELSDMLENEIVEVKHDIDKRGKRKGWQRGPCGFTWRCRRRRRKGKRNGISHHAVSFFGDDDDLDHELDENTIYGK